MRDKISKQLGVETVAYLVLGYFLTDNHLYLLFITIMNENKNLGTNKKKSSCFMFILISFLTGYFGFLISQSQIWETTIARASFEPVQLIWWTTNYESIEEITWTREITNDKLIQSWNWIDKQENVKRDNGLWQTDFWKKSENKPVENTNQPKVQSGGKIRHSGFKKDDPRQDMVRMTYAVWWMKQVIVQECENWNRDPFAIWDWGHAHWLCQINTNYHTLPKEYFEDRGYQIKYCNEKISWWTKFYWPERMLYKKVDWKKVPIWLCKDVVVKRFIFE